MNASFPHPKLLVYCLTLLLYSGVSHSATTSATKLSQDAANSAITQAQGQTLNQTLNQNHFTPLALKQFRKEGKSARQTATQLLAARSSLKPGNLLIALRQAGYTSTQSARAIKHIHHLNSAILTDLMFDQKFSVTQSCRVLKHVYQAEAKQALVQLAISGYSKTGAIDAIKSIYQVENKTLILQLSKGYTYKIETNKENTNINSKTNATNNATNKATAKQKQPTQQQTAAQQSSVQKHPSKKAKHSAPANTPVIQSNTTSPKAQTHNPQAMRSKPRSKPKRSISNTPNHKFIQRKSRQVASVLHKQGVKAELAAYLLQTRYDIDLAHCAQLLRYVGYQDNKVYSALFNTYSPKSSELINGFIAAGYRVDQVLPFLIKNFSLSNERLSQQLQTAGYTSLVVNRALKKAHFPLVAKRAVSNPTIKRSRR